METLYGEWERVFGKVYGDKATATRVVLDELIETHAAIVGTNPEEVNILRLIFSIHTYYNIILKLLVSELLSSLLNPFSRKGITLAVSDLKFQQQVKRIVTGDYFKIAGVQNFFEMGFFEWWSYAWTPEINGLLREVIELPGTDGGDDLDHQKTGDHRRRGKGHLPPTDAVNPASSPGECFPRTGWLT